MKDITFPFTINLFKGINGDNGATPWYTKMKLGLNRQMLNLAFDSGTTDSWVTSTRCTSDACLMHNRFTFNNSPTFKQISDQFNPVQISFGPWGSMMVSVGSDCLAFEDAETDSYFSIDNYTLYLAHSYSGFQFSNLVWDGAIAIPSDTTGATTSELISQLLKNDNCRFKNIKFNYKKSRLEIGADETEIIHKFPLKVNNTYHQLWFLNLHKIEINGSEIIKSSGINEVDLCIDTGSSRFKGDPKILNAMINAITFNGLLPTYIPMANPNLNAYPNLLLVIGDVEFELTPKDYFEKLSESLYVLAFNPMEGLDNIFIAGSVFLEKFNPVFYYQEDCSKGVSIGFDI